jgi:peptidoglycan/xylan/chitin deacetylase (PgdA/CDA1 family)
MRIPGRRRLAASLRWLRSRRGDRALILGYHRVTEDPHDPYHIAIRPEDFAAQLEALRRHATPVRLGHLQKAIADRKPLHRHVVVTFDDGYLDVLEHAKPLLERFDVPATVFAVSGAMGAPFWWDVLDAMLRGAQLPPQISLELDGIGTVHWRRSEGPESSALLALLHDRLEPLPTETRDRALAALGRELGTSPPKALRHRAMRPEELVQLVDGGLVTVGSHSVTHPCLPARDVATQRAEIVDSRTALERVLGSPVTEFSYPHGAFTRSTAELVRRAGFACAVSSSNDVVSYRSDAFSLPRFWLPSRATAHLDRFLRRWLG